MKPRLLFVSPRFLFPLDQGHKIHTGNILRGMKGGAFEITLASPAPMDHRQYRADINAVCDRFVWWPDQVATKLKRLLAAASRLPLAAATARSTVGRDIVRLVLVERPDAVIVDFPHADVLMPPRIDAATIMFTHNIEAEIFERHLKHTTGLQRLIWAGQSRKMARLEHACLARYDTVVATSMRERDALAKRYHRYAVEAIDTGVDLDFFKFSPPEPEPGADGGTLVFTAPMNRFDGLHFLLDKVFPLLLPVRPNIKAVVIGQDPSALLFNKITGSGLAVTLAGYVNDIRPHVAAANVCVIPLFVGSRTKAFEAMAMGRPVVSTTQGIEGLDVTDGTHFLRADNAPAFAQAILTLLDDAALRIRIANAARALMEERSSWPHVARQLEAICQRVLERRR